MAGVSTSFRMQGTNDIQRLCNGKGNEGTSWPVESGHGLVSGCSQPDFWDAGGFTMRLIPVGELSCT